MSSTDQQVKQIVAEQLGVSPDVVTSQASFVADLHVDARRPRRVRPYSAPRRQAWRWERLDLSFRP
ncbi:MAG: hypothetical protein ACRDRH_07655 [Pseudonocardia sp.]